MNEPKIIEMYADGKEYGSITKEELIEYGSDRKMKYRMEEWENACEYLSRFTDDAGTCRLDLRKLVETGAPDYCKTITVCMIFEALEKLGRKQDIPEDIITAEAPFLSARITELLYSIHKLNKLNEFQETALCEIETVLTEHGSLDECFDRLMDTAPPSESYAVITKTQKQKYLSGFRIMRKAADLCSSPCYAEQIEEYITALS